MTRRLVSIAALARARVASTLSAGGSWRLANAKAPQRSNIRTTAILASMKKVGRVAQTLPALRE
jgi:hypothetical protein